MFCGETMEQDAGGLPRAPESSPELPVSRSQDVDMDDVAENPLAHENVVTSGFSPPNGSTYIPNHPSYLGPGPWLRPPSG